MVVPPLRLHIVPPVDPLCPRFEAAGYRLVNNLRAWFLYESRTGLQVGDTAGSPRNLRTLIWALLHAEHPEITEEQAGALPQAVTQAAGLALATALPDESIPLKAEHARRPTDWYRLWSIGRFDLHLTDEEFWALHPLQFHHLSLRLDARIEREFYGHCITAAMIRNCHIDPKETEPIAPMALMPTASGERAREQLNAGQQSASLLDKIKGWKLALEGMK
mgnify:CR=1 FL=1